MGVALPRPVFRPLEGVCVPLARPRPPPLLAPLPRAEIALGF